MVLTDEILAQVIDFSEAERSGYLLAFAKFRIKHGDSRTQDQLLTDGAKLLKGCEQHFRNAVTCIKHISSIIPVEDEKKFKKLVMKLCSVPNQEEFEAIAHCIVKKWLHTSTWLAWWTRESHASMIFKLQQIMDVEVWDSIPGSMNAEETMHWKLYSGAGCDHDVIKGFEGLLSIANYYERLNEAALESIEEATCLGGSIETWFQELMQANQAGHLMDACWHNAEGVSPCCGKPQLLEFYVSLPIILTISVDDWDPKHWDFPASFTPTSLKDDHNYGLVYDIMACIFLIDGNHFQTCYRTPTPDNKGCTIYIYNGMRSKGYATHKQKATLVMHMTGEEVIDRPDKSYHTQMVIYQLHGGRTAQKAFLQAQLGIAERVHGLSFDSHDVSIVPDVAFTR
ncbi:uncharacterized protein EV420DRAFT_1651313 [Desarmillaria tabescens]|uniref:Uncharacterized protein n=1 Tax=Armillaria tabescens TaxID=1929756 RepID=A0AA39MMC9_ARMTA|nr:uncharacterized protein EV420DRAFT_1651313 [Desarmillaria tabescens]KAK0438725.1 hypothetical protein EV420DRAFT_1651313 [Desarmillaria tabescens]